MNVLVNGIGNIGTTVLNILIDYQEMLHIEKIYALKNTAINSWNQKELQILAEKGVVICTQNGQGYIPLSKVEKDIHYVFDCNANGFAMKNKAWYSELPNLIGACAQGSEKFFGESFMSSVNETHILNEKFVHIVSCNTHSIASLLSTLTCNDIDDVVEGDFVVVRRSEDIGNHQRLVTANVVSRHMEAEVGTHHAIDVKDLYNTINVSLPIQSSDITTPSQLMHTVRFNIKMNKLLDLKKINQAILDSTFVSVSEKFDSNIIFEMGRRYSPYGRLFSHTIININNLLLDKQNNAIKGWAFIPQEGNTILSTIHAFLLQINHFDVDNIMCVLKTHFIEDRW